MVEDEHTNGVARENLALIEELMEHGPLTTSNIAKALVAVPALIAEVQRLGDIVDRQLGSCIGCTPDSGPEEVCPHHGRTYSEWVDIASRVIGRQNDLREQIERLAAENEALRGNIAKHWRDRQIFALLEAADPKLRNEVITAWVERDQASAALAAEREKVTATPENIEALCEVMHDAYEWTARDVGWATNDACHVPWAELPTANKLAMRAAVDALLVRLSAKPRRAALSTQEAGE